MEDIYSISNFLSITFTKIKRERGNLANEKRLLTESIAAIHVKVSVFNLDYY
jgi:hypothetical protein